MDRNDQQHRDTSPDPDRIVVVTGGTGGLGRWIVARFAANGNRVYLPVREPMTRGPVARPGDGSTSGSAESGGDRPVLDEESRSRIVYRACDVTRPDHVEDLVEGILEDEGRIDVVVSCVGGFTMDPVDETDPASWSKMMAINATSAFLVARGVLPSMKAVGWGRIVNVASMPALKRGSPGMAAYGASKAALVHFTHSAAEEVAGEGITVNAVAPTVIDTPANRSADPEADWSAWIHPDEIADVIAFLTSDAGGVVTGSAISLSKG